MPDLSLSHAHRWDLTPGEAIQLQQELRERVLVQPLSLGQISTVAGVDVGFRDEKARAAAVLLSFPSLQLLEHAVREVPIPFPYVPGLLSFRETPAILNALEGLSVLPDVIVCDGQGLAHPRRFGIACHLGVLLDRPTLGCAKSILVGKHGPLGEEPGSTADLKAGGETIGAAVRTRQGVKPVYVSVGSRIDLPSAVELILACNRGYRLPEPTRLADRLASNRGPLPPVEPPNQLSIKF
jgi:deoxyribonuclease V